LLIAAGFKAKKPQNPKQQKLYDGLSADRCSRSYARVGAPSTKDGGHLIVAESQIFGQIYCSSCRSTVCKWWWSGRVKTMLSQ
jgi:hypothetical protein